MIRIGPDGNQLNENDSGCPGKQESLLNNNIPGLRISGCRMQLGWKVMQSPVTFFCGLSGIENIPLLSLISYLQSEAMGN